MPAPEPTVDAEVLLAFLEDPASYPHGPKHVEVVQTHASYVALAPPRVYKVKKPVDLGFLDFSTLERRRHFCEVEVRLNRRLCTGVYLGVVPIMQDGAQLVLDGEAGDAVEYAVAMQYLDEDGFLNRRLARGAVTEADLDRVVGALCAFYRAQTPDPELAEWGRVEALRISTDENFAQTEAYVGTLLTRPAYEALRYYTGRFYEAHALLFNRRRAEGHLLDCHGDLHLEHIHLSPERVCIYDCIEFNDRFRSIDVANDVAFLAMDLDYNGRPDLARYVTERIADALGDAGLLKLAGFYRGYRAYVRGKVESMKSTEEEVPEADRAASRERAVRYYQLALQYAVAGAAPMVVVVMGPVGSGKSTQAAALGAALGWEVASSDRTRKEMAGVPLYERGSEEARAALYAPAMTERTYGALHDRAVAAARQGHSLVLDATYGRRAHRDALREALRPLGVPCCFIELSASSTTLKDRLLARERGDAVVSDARLDDFEMLQAGYEAPDALEDARHLALTTEVAPSDTTLVILKQLIQLALC